MFPIEKRAPATESFHRKFSGVRNSHVSRAAVSGFCHILHRSGSIKESGGPVSFAPRGVSRAGHLRGPQGAGRPRSQAARRGPAWVRPPPLPAPQHPRGPLAAGLHHPVRSLLCPRQARSLMATPERTGSCLTSRGTSTAVTPPAPGSLTVASAGHATGMMSREEDRKSRVQNAGERDE